jgi:Zn-finger nucleic acid-binding protein
MSGFDGFGGGHSAGPVERPRYCTDDGAPLNKRQDPSGIVIDECPRCGQNVLDRGELQAIISHVSSRPNFRPQPQVAQAYYAPGGHSGGHGHTTRRHHRDSDSLFGEFFGTS